MVEKSCPLDLLHDHLGQDHLAKVQLQQNLLENDSKKKLENTELEKKSFDKSFQSLILEKLVALMPEKHFALAASSRLLGNEAWEEHREASEINFDKVGDKELLQKSFEEKSLAAKTFGQLTFGHFAQTASKRTPSQKRPLPTPAWAKTPSERAA